MEEGGIRLVHEAGRLSRLSEVKHKRRSSPPSKASFKAYCPPRGLLVRRLRHEAGDYSSRKRIEDVRCPAVNGLPDDIYHMLHHSFVEILKMRRSIESADAHIDTSMEAILKSRDVLKRLRNDGF